MQAEELYKRKFLKKPFDSFLLRYDYKALFFRNGVFFALNLFRGGRSQDIHQELTLLNLFLFFVSLSFSLIIRMSYNFMFSLLGFVTTNMFGLWQVNKGYCAAYLRRGNSAGIFSRGGKKSFCRSSVCFADFNSAEHLSWKIQRGRNLTGICTSGSVDCHNYNRRKYYMEESCKASCYSGRMIWA